MDLLKTTRNIATSNHNKTKSNNKFTCKKCRCLCKTPKALTELIKRVSLIQTLLHRQDLLKGSFHHLKSQEMEPDQK